MEDTIAAIATAFGEGGIGIVRISGEDSKNILSSVLKDEKGQSKSFKDRMLTYGHIYDGKEIIDEVMAVYLPSPHTYTREDVVEIDCHGSVVSLQRILRLVLREGARLAEPGEFTKRAFLNGRIDLSQAEAVMDIVRAKTDRTFDVAVSQLEGSFSDKIKEIRADLTDILVDITVNIDYPDEDIEVLTYENLNRGLSSVLGEIDKLLSTSKNGKMIREGIKVSLIGKPNVGKSSLMNALLRRSRAIVTDIPGTTRDTIEESLQIGGIPVVLTDTAGIRDASDEIEKIGIEKSKEAFNNSDLIILLLDGSSEIEEEDLLLMEYIGNRKSLVAINKSDLGTVISMEKISSLLPDSQILNVSVKEGKGIEDIEKSIENMVTGGQVAQESSLIVTNVRHEDLLRRSKESVEQAMFMIDSSQPLEFIEVDVNLAYRSLGEIIGESVEEDIINEVFSRFCLGK